MRKIILLSLIMVVFAAGNVLAVKGIGMGIRAGYVTGFDNPDVPGSLKSLDKLPMLGAHLDIGIIPIIDVVASAEYAWETVNDIMPGVDLTYGDFSLNGTAIYRFSVPVVSPHLGAGLGLHRLVYSWKGSTGSVILPDDQTKMSWHGLGGVSLNFPALPFSVFVEGRYSSLQTDPETTNFTSFLGGVTFGF
jgi:opacity protein-like surface antigen